ncbi:MAG: hypothetical protein JO060_12405 [Candidatus Eremiobacteraeota bacterium]|nr:hypothetical protein [Candidatus Eremiobacteraeota bacterium]
MTAFERLRALPARGKALAAGLLLAACGAVAIALFLSRDASVALFAEPLRPEQVAEIAERLASWNVAFTPLSDNVRVDARQRNALLLRLSMAGVPHAHVATSQEALQKAGPLTPQSVLDAERQEGLAGDLQLALRGVAGIEDARVMLADDRPNIFTDEAPRPATASVRLTLRPGATLSRDALGGIRAFVAGAVSGLDAKRVALLDDRGVPLAETASSTNEAVDLQASLQSALDAAFGSDATIVRVRVAYDGRQHEVHDARREPLGAQAIVASHADERYANDKKRYTKSTATEDHGSTLHEERTSLAPGATEHISVAVLVDAARRLDPLKIREIAVAAAGLEARRGDTVSVEAVPFRRIAQKPETLQTTMLGYAASFGPALLFLGGALVALRIVARPALDLATSLNSRATLRSIRASADGLSPAQVRATLSNEPPHTVAAVLSGLSSSTAAAVLESYDPETRGAIVRYMSQPMTPLARDAHVLLRSRSVS